MSKNLTDLLYLVTIVTFILALRFLSSPATARRGNQVGAAGMVLAIVVTFAQKGMGNFWLIALGMILGGGFGAVAARRVKMTAMPQMVALFNGVGGGAAALISMAEFHTRIPAPGNLHVDTSLAIVLSALIGSVSFSGSMIAFAKLQELIQGRPITYPGQKVGNLVLLGAAAALGIAICAGWEAQWALVALIGLSLLFGVLFVLPIGGADMPVVISLLNAFTGLAVAATGFELENNVLIVSGMLVGASGTFLTMMMSKAMNRSIANVLFGAFGQVTAEAAATAADGHRHRALRERRRRRDHARLRPARDHRPGLRDGRRAGAARRAPARRPARGTRRQGRLRDPPRRRPHAGAHERPPRRGERAVHGS